jgi:hypothetical protein
MDKKQIEELARLIKLPIESWLEDTGAIPYATTYYAELMSRINDSAEVVFNENYRKITENEVVISKAEYNDLKGLEKRFDDYLIKEIIEARKETAREILKPLYDDCKDDSYGQVVVDFAILENLARKYSVDLGEEK